MNKIRVQILSFVPRTRKNRPEISHLFGPRQERRRRFVLPSAHPARPEGHANLSVIDAKSSVIDANSSVIDANLSVIDAKSSVIDANSSVIDANLSVIDAKSSCIDAHSSVIDADLPVIDADSPVMGAEPLFIGAHPAGSTGSSLARAASHFAHYDEPMSETPEARRARIERLEKQVKEIQGFDPKSIVRQDTLGSKFSFAECEPYLERIVALYQRLPVEVLSSLGTESFGAISADAKRVQSRIAAALQFDPAQSDASQRARIIQDIKDTYGQSADALAPAIAFAASASTEMAARLSKAVAAIDGAREEANARAGEVKGVLDNANKILGDIKSAAGESGIAAMANYFEREADFHQVEADKWLWSVFWTTALLLVAAIAAILVHVFGVIPLAGPYDVVQFTVAKGLVFVVLFFFLALSSRNLSAHRHNFVINRHRHNALCTYRAIIDAANDKSSKDIVLTKAAECVFGPQPTGFTKGESGSEGGNISLVSMAPASFKPSGQ